MPQSFGVERSRIKPRRRRGACGYAGIREAPVGPEVVPWCQVTWPYAWVEVTIDQFWSVEIISLYIEKIWRERGMFAVSR